MTVVYIEARPKGREEGTHITDYVVEDHADHVLATCKTQHEAIEWAKKHGHTGPSSLSLKKRLPLIFQVSTEHINMACGQNAHALADFERFDIALQQAWKIGNRCLECGEDCGE
jgi:hypothetical protein